MIISTLRTVQIEKKLEGWCVPACQSRWLHDVVPPGWRRVGPEFETSDW